jgi:FlaA1/EpsC-like NDP-sugar epimerase
MLVTVSYMMRLSNLTLRNLLIAVHDALATTLALFASFYLRFEGDAFFERLPLLLRILPYFVAFSVVVCYLFNLTTTKWRFISLPDALNIVRVATVLTLALLVLDYIFVAPIMSGSHCRPRTSDRRSFSARSLSFSTGSSRCSF